MELVDIIQAVFQYGRYCINGRAFCMGIRK